MFRWNFHRQFHIAKELCICLTGNICLIHRRIYISLRLCSWISSGWIIPWNELFQFSLCIFELYSPGNNFIIFLLLLFHCEQPRDIYILSVYYFKVTTKRFIFIIHFFRVPSNRKTIPLPKISEIFSKFPSPFTSHVSSSKISNMKIYKIFSPYKNRNSKNTSSY